jgi:hypothetical protein
MGGSCSTSSLIVRALGGILVARALGYGPSPIEKNNSSDRKTQRLGPFTPKRLDLLLAAVLRHHFVERSLRS